MKIIILSVDSLRADSLSCYGYGRNTSPSIDDIARAGIVFKEAYTQCNWTYPSYFSLITGMYPSTHRIDWFDQKILDNIKTLPEVLSDAGYKTYMFSNYYSLINKGRFGRHFDEAIEFEIDKNWIDLKNLFKSEADNNLFALIHIGDYVHEPFCAPMQIVQEFWDDEIPSDDVIATLTAKEFDTSSMRKVLRGINLRTIRLNSTKKRYLKACYDAGIKYVDKWIGELFSFITETFKDEVYLFISADHGQAFFEHGFFGHGLNLHQETIKVPLILWSNSYNRNKSIEAPVGLIDIFPTIMDILDQRNIPQIDGKSLEPYFEKEKTHVNRMVISEGFPFLACLEGKNKLITSFYRILPHEEKRLRLHKARTEGSLRRFLYHCYTMFKNSLYDLSRDSSEKRNLYFSRRADAKRMTGTLRKWYKGCCEKALTTGKEDVDEQVKEQLKNLGYID
jgi:arylsulfatase A-like enzyme